MRQRRWWMIACGVVAAAAMAFLLYTRIADADQCIDCAGWDCKNQAGCLEPCVCDTEEFGGTYQCV